MAKKPPKKPVRPSNGSAGKKTKQKAAAKPKSEEVVAIGVPIEREFPSGQVPLFANHFVVQHDGPEFYLMFFQTTPPIIIADSPEERKKQIEKLGSVKSQCVARIVMTAGRMPAVIKAMQTTLETHQKIEEATGATGE